MVIICSALDVRPALSGFHPANARWPNRFILTLVEFRAFSWRSSRRLISSFMSSISASGLSVLLLKIRFFSVISCPVPSIPAAILLLSLRCMRPAWHILRGSIFIFSRFCLPQRNSSAPFLVKFGGFRLQSPITVAGNSIKRFTISSSTSVPSSVTTVKMRCSSVSKPV